MEDNAELYRNNLIYSSLIHDGDWKKIYDDLVNRRVTYPPQDIERAIKKLKCKALTILDVEYPSELKQACQPPFVLFYYGNIDLIRDISNIVGVVGSREYSSYGEKITRGIVKELSSKYIIISGMAKGIDHISHDQTIRSGGKTIAIMCTGIDKVYPASSLDIYNEMKQNHLVMSEYPGRVAPPLEQFPFRNRIIAALSRCLIVTEAYSHSGTSITASYALNMGKDVYCVPYHSDENSFCNTLINLGAELIENPKQLLEDIELDHNLKKI